MPGKRVFSRSIRCPGSGFFFRLPLISDFSSGVGSDRALFVRGEPMVPFVLVTGIWVVASCGRNEECPRCRGRSAPAALDLNHRFLIPKVGQPVLASWLDVGESVVPRRVWISLVKLPEFL